VRRFVIGGIVILVAAVVFIVGNHLKSATASDGTRYRTAVVSTGTVTKTVSATGVLTPWTSVDVKSKAAGRVNALLVDVGSVVHTGQVLAKIDPTDTLLAVQTAQADINGDKAKVVQSTDTYGMQAKQSEIAVANAQASLDAAKAAVISARAKAQEASLNSTAQPAETAAAIAQAKSNADQAVANYNELNTSNSQDLASAQSALAQAQANNLEAKAALARQQALLAGGFVAAQTVDTYKQTYDVTTAQLDAAKQKMDTINQQHQLLLAASQDLVKQTAAALKSAQAAAVAVDTQRLAAVDAAAAYKDAQAQAAVAQAALDNAKAGLANVPIQYQNIAINKALVQGNQADLTNAQSTLDQTVVRAPNNGVVLVKDVAVGTYITSGIDSVSGGTTIVTIGDDTRMYVYAEVDETDIGSVAAGQKVDVDFDAYPGVPFSGTVTLIDPDAVVNQNVTQFDVRVEIDNTSPSFRLLMPGMNATCTFNVDSKDNVLNVPNNAVQTDTSGDTYVLIAHGGTPAPVDPTSRSASAEGLLVNVRTEKRSVVTGLDGDNDTEIQSGLKEGDVVVAQTYAAPSTAAVSSSTPSPTGAGGRGGFGGGGR